jgi:hypothetical protein
MLWVLHVKYSHITRKSRNGLAHRPFANIIRPPSG